MGSFLKASTEFIKAVHCEDEGFRSFHDYKTGEKIIIDAFIEDRYGDGWLAVVRRDAEEQISKILHLSKIKEFIKLYEVELAYEEEGYGDPEHNCLAHDAAQAEIDENICPSCGYAGEYISGDDVYFGYIGWPICPECRVS